MRKQRDQAPMPTPPPGHSGTGKALAAPPPPGAPQFQVATNQADALQPFLASGGYTFWPEPAEFEEDWIDPAGDGAQLVASVFVPNGKVAFCKEIRIAPLKPAVLADVWNTVGVFQQLPDPELPFGTYQAHREITRTYTGLWDVPLGWESYDVASAGALSGGYIPDPWQRQLAWQWQLTLVDGPLAAIRSANNIPPFSFADPVSWFMVESLPVPASVYRQGFPGRPAGPLWQPQRYQVMPGDTLQTHVIVPENTTLCLWARWYNVVTDGGEDPDIVGVNIKFGKTSTGTTENYGTVPGGTDPTTTPAFVPVIGPSVGSLHGYMQPVVSRGSNENAVLGWGG